jgi:hypothetical protein
MKPRLIGILWGITSLMIISFATLAQAHDAPSGWAYPSNCCSGVDCREVNDGHSSIRVGERPEGYVISSTGEVIAYMDPKVKPSPDGEYHWCSASGLDTGNTICLFVPPKGF